MDKTLKIHPEKISANELRDVLSSCTAFSGFSEEDYNSLAKDANRVFAPAGALLLKQGEFTEIVTVLEHGRFVACIPARSGETLTLELGRGEVLALATSL